MSETGLSEHRSLKKGVRGGFGSWRIGCLSSVADLQFALN